MESCFKPSYISSLLCSCWSFMFFILCVFSTLQSLYAKLHSSNICCMGILFCLDELKIFYFFGPIHEFDLNILKMCIYNLHILHIFCCYFLYKFLYNMYMQVSYKFNHLSITFLYNSFWAKCYSK
jgi:hypothetical protein